MGRVTFPTDALVGRDTALCLFAAAFGGQNDAQYLRDAGLKTVCVDTDHAKLGAMVLEYPVGWEYYYGDAFGYMVATDRVWDVVTVDCPTNLFDRCVAELPLICGVARSVVVLGNGGEPVGVPDGWHITDVHHRSTFNGGVYWLELHVDE